VISDQAAVAEYPCCSPARNTDTIVYELLRSIEDSVPESGALEADH